MSKEVSMRASKRKPSAEAKKMAGKVRHIMVEGAANGASTKTYRHPAPGENQYDMPEPQPMLHTNAASMGQHIASEMADSFPKAAAKPKGKMAPAPADDDAEDDAQAA